MSCSIIELLPLNYEQVWACAVENLRKERKDKNRSIFAGLLVNIKLQIFGRGGAK